MLAAEELDHLEPADTATAERPQKQRRALGIESRDNAGRDAGRGADMAVPQAQEVVALIGGGEPGGMLERAPGRFGRGEIVINGDTRNSRVDRRNGGGSVVKRS